MVEVPRQEPAQEDYAEAKVLDGKVGWVGVVRAKDWIA